MKPYFIKIGFAVLLIILAVAFSTQLLAQWKNQLGYNFNNPGSAMCSNMVLSSINKQLLLSL